MSFIFPAVIQAGIDAGKYEAVRNASGVVLGVARDKATGQFVGHAVGMLSNSGIPFNPVTVPLQFAQMYQAHQGFQAVRASLGILQTMTAVTGVGVALNLSVSAVGLWQILKLRADVKKQRVEIHEGFINLENILQGQSTEIVQRISDAIDETEQRQHRLALSRSYGRFLQATEQMQTAISCEDMTVKNTDLANARQILRETLADYRNRYLLPDANAVSQLRRFECAWTIEQTIVMTYQLQDEWDSAKEQLGRLYSQIPIDVGNVLDSCDAEDELDVIGPEVLRIHEQDLSVLKLWRERIEWVRTLPVAERLALQDFERNDTGLVARADAMVPDCDDLAEQKLYLAQKEDSYFVALCDSLRFLMQPDQRKEYEQYICQQAIQSSYESLAGDNLKQMSELSLANLYWYFRVRDDSSQEEEALTSA